MTLDSKLNKRCFVKDCKNEPISALHPDSDLEDYRFSCIDHEKEIWEKLKKDYPSSSVYILDVTELYG